MAGVRKELDDRRAEVFLVQTQLRGGGKGRSLVPTYQDSAEVNKRSARDERLQSRGPNPWYSGKAASGQDGPLSWRARPPLGSLGEETEQIPESRHCTPLRPEEAEGPMAEVEVDSGWGRAAKMPGARSCPSHVLSALALQTQKIASLAWADPMRASSPCRATMSELGA